MKFHSFRHKFASLALQDGIHVKSVSSMLGHSGAGFALATYTHSTNRSQAQAAARMGDLLSKTVSLVWVKEKGWAGEQPCPADGFGG